MNIASLFGSAEAPVTTFDTANNDDVSNICCLLSASRLLLDHLACFIVSYISGKGYRINYLIQCCAYTHVLSLCGSACESMSEPPHVPPISRDKTAEMLLCHEAGLGKKLFGSSSLLHIISQSATICQFRHPLSW